MKAVVGAFNQEKALVGAFSVITNLRMELFEALHGTHQRTAVTDVTRWSGFDYTMCSIHCDENFELSLTYKLKWWYLINSFLFLPILSFSSLLIPFLPIHSYSFRFLPIPTLCISSYVFLPNTFRNLLIPTKTFLFLLKPPYFFQFCPFPSYVFLLLPNHISCKEVLATKYLAWVSVIVNMAGVIW